MPEARANRVRGGGIYLSQELLTQVCTLTWYTYAGPAARRLFRFLLTCFERDARKRNPRQTNQTHSSHVYSRDGPIGRRKRGYILTTDQSDAGITGTSSRWSNRIRSDSQGVADVRAKRLGGGVREGEAERAEFAPSADGTGRTHRDLFGHQLEHGGAA
eukprot:8957621-Pyramimonas_sp.AAC.1